MNVLNGRNLDECMEYLRKEGLLRLLGENLFDSSPLGTYDAVRGTLPSPIPPDPCDLARLHWLIRDRFCLTVLEFGVGFSSLVIADALRRNEEEYSTRCNARDIRNRFAFQHFVVDASREWLKTVEGRFPSDLRNRVTFCFSTVSIGKYRDQICHYYDDLPDVVPDFVYLDGPSPKDVEGRVNGLSFLCDERTVMSGDLLLMEPTFLPGMTILVDGRTNNARFLKRNFSRDYRHTWDSEGDFTLFELSEDRLGRYNYQRSDFRGPGVETG